MHSLLGTSEPTVKSPGHLLLQALLALTLQDSRIPSSKAAARMGTVSPQLPLSLFGNRANLLRTQNRGTSKLLTLKQNLPFGGQAEDVRAWGGRRPLA